MIKKNDQIKILYICTSMMEFCHEASKTIGPTQMNTEAMQKTCEGLGRIFSSLENDFETISKLIMKGFTKKEIKTMIEINNMETKIDIQYLVKNAGKLHRKYVETYIEEHKKFNGNHNAIWKNTITNLVKQKAITKTDTKYLIKLVDIVTSKEKMPTINEQLVQIQKPMNLECGDIAKTIVAIAVDSTTGGTGEPVNGPIALADVGGAIAGAGLGLALCVALAGPTGGATLSAIVLFSVIGGIVGGGSASGAAAI